MLKMRKQNKNEIIENPAVSKGTGIVITIVMTLLAVAFLFPIFLVLMNSFKNKLYFFFFYFSGICDFTDRFFPIH